MTSIFFVLLSVLVVQECWGTDNPASEEGFKKVKALLEASKNTITQIQEILRPCENDDCDISQKPRDCKELQDLGNIKSGAYIIWLTNKFFEERPVLVYCDMETAGGGWTVIQRRGNYSTPANYFNEIWSTYKEGFGDIQGEFWLGNDNIYDLTNQKLYSIHFDLKTYAGVKGYADYSLFYIDGEDNNYSIHIKNYSGNAGDGMKYHDGQQFSTPDRDNDIGRTHCAKEYSAGWWYMHCFTANLNGIRGSDYDKQNLPWHPFKKAYNDPISEVEIKIRPRS